jgi:hypothetical protein
MKTNFLLCTLLFCLLGLGSASAQWAAGVRLGGASGLSLKKYSRYGGADFEVIAAKSFDDKADGFGLTLMLEKFADFTNDNKFGAILGVGETMVFADEFWFGISGTIGFELRLGRIAVQGDWLPTFFFVDDAYFTPINGAVTARWVFGGF